MMYRIAICEDDPLAAEQNSVMIRRILDGWGMRAGKDYNMDIFFSPEPLISRFTAQYDAYQLLLLDIRLEDANGMELAAYLREKQLDVSIIYVTAYRDFALDSFPTHPIEYLIKPVDEDRLAAALEWDLRSRDNKKRLMLRVKGLAIPLEDILYLEISGRKVAIHTKSDLIHVSETLSGMESQLPEHYFCRSHFSFLINLAHVREISRFQLIMDNGQSVPVSRRYYHTLMNRYMDWLR